MNPKQDEKAIEALVAACLRAPDVEAELTDDEIKPFLDGTVKVPPEDEVALEALGPNVIQQIVPSESSLAAEKRSDQIQTEVHSELFVAMNRKNTQDEFSAHTKEEIERKRRELLERIRRKKQK